MGSNQGKCSSYSQDRIPPQSDLQFRINGKRFCVRPGSIPHDTSLNSFIRIYAGLTGTKFMCREGGCGCCTVNSITGKDWVGSVNSCLMSVFSCHGMEVVTIEGIGGKASGFHAIQARLARMNGTQCGFCSPGMVMSMLGLIESRKGRVSMAEVENSLGGNICRCTGYRPILDAFKSLADDADPTLPSCPDIEDLPMRCVFAGEPPSKFDYDFVRFGLENGREWFRVTSVEHVLKIFEKSHNRPYMLVAGNTGHGVFRRREDLEIFIDVSGVEELRIMTLGDTLEVGAAVTLSEFMGFLSEASEAKREFSYCRQLVRHLDLVAHPAVRNLATIGGNLSLKHQHPEFPSDIFLLLETVGAFLTIVDSDGVHRVTSVEEFMFKSMRKRVILKVILPPLHPDKFCLATYKIMPRAQNAHAMVNAGFLFKFSPGRSVAQSARICFGGINSRFIHASKTENLVMAKSLFSNETVALLMASLNEELKLNWILPDPSPRYRKLLALGLFYKAILSVAPVERVRECVRSGGEEIFRGLSSGKQEVTGAENAMIKLNAEIQCSGEANYINDLPCMPGEVWAAFVPATEVSARILSIDASVALRIPGVVAFFSAKDIPGINNYMTHVLVESLEILEPEEIFCSGKVLFHNQPAGIILAENMDLAIKAAKAVQINYSRPIQRKLFLSVEDVLDSEEHERVFSYETRLDAIDRGVEIAATIAGKLNFSNQYHFHLEPQTTVCVPKESGIEVHSATHFLHFTQMGISQVCNIPMNSISMKLERIGGSFGAKNSKSTHLACAAALACIKLRRPVRFIMSIEDNMMIIGKRFPATSSYAVEVDKNGKIQKLNNSMYMDLGISKNEASDRSVIISFFTALYSPSTWSMDFRGVHTDVHPYTWFRSPGCLEGIAMAENIMEHIAKELRMDPLLVRLENMRSDSPMRSILPEFLEKCDFETRKGHIKLFNANNRWRKRGIAFASMGYPIQTTYRYAVLVAVYAIDGTVSVCHGGIEMGQGIDTKMVQIAARTLGVPVKSVKIEAANTVINANVTFTSSSQTTDAIGRLVIEACNRILQRIKPIREEMPLASWPELVKTAYERNVSLASFVTDMEKDRISYNVYGVSCAEMEIDVLTGDFLLRRVDISQDVGESLNPDIDIGQIEGAFVMGLGYWLQEKIIHHPDTGEILTNRTWNYKPPGAKDIPVDFRVSFMNKQNLPVGLLGAKGTGEPATALSIVAIFALRNAIESARESAGFESSFIALKCPTTKEDILLLSGTRSCQFHL
ncbi:uncharacterized protein LOC132259207 [Phlebotomus argentipes]|uniref:uncharacterized protein LOC132259207 n=1 Tax=Phlebotomus argentipes TaxID=94469 RepID=UPI002892E735|nr:uncharacterized protein LOC132259207 [Phlebotomus argentipes]